MDPVASTAYSDNGLALLTWIEVRGLLSALLWTLVRVLAAASACWGGGYLAYGALRQSEREADQADQWPTPDAEAGADERGVTVVRAEMISHDEMIFSELERGLRQIEDYLVCARLEDAFLEELCLEEPCLEEQSPASEEGADRDREAGSGPP